MAPRIVTSDSSIDRGFVDTVLVGYVVDLTVEPETTDPTVVTIQVTGTRRDDAGYLLIVGHPWDAIRDAPTGDTEIAVRYEDLTEIEVF
ncbi:MAG TPA: hypothetical protein VNQ73_02570 [Ilumatobacter sp.]|nr:hypothetical protein [Ilumatobacter sp.]